MTATAPAQSKITYTSADVDWQLFHRQFDDALAHVRSQLGRDYPLYIGGAAVTSSAKPIVDTSPIDTSVVLGNFATATAAHVSQAVAAARAAQAAWGRRDWHERVAILHRAAALIRERKYELAAIMSLEVGKSRLEAMGDAEESADLIDYYCGQVENADGFVRQMAKVTPVERNTDVLRPYGVFACIAPFNFPLALSTGMSSAALVAGNAVVYKPAEDAPWTGHELYTVYRDAGLPPGLFNYLSGHGAEAGEALWRHPQIDGVVFTGSKTVGMHIYHDLSSRWIKPCLLKIGDPTERDVFFGPVINAESVAKFERAVARARKEGEILLGGGRLTGERFDRGHFVAPTIARLPLESALFREELFVPFLAIGEVSGLDQAIAETNKADYGLTAGIFSKRDAEITRFFDAVEAGVCYVNKRTGATTGAWPGAQPFTGWKGSGSSGKGGCGPYYVAQFMREQSRTVIDT